MENLKKIIESTLINNIETDYGTGYTLESIQTCSDYISKEIQDIAIAFATHMSEYPFNIQALDEQQKKQFYSNFLEERYEQQ